MTKLSPKDVRAIKKALPKKTDTELAEKYDVDRTTINKIRLGKTWKHV